MNLILGNIPLPYEKCVENLQNEFIKKLISYLELKSDSTSMDYINVINSCEHCDHGIHNNKQGYYEHACDIWYISVLVDEEENAFVCPDTETYYDLDWHKIMGKDYDWTQEEIRVYRCRNCQHWEVDNDC